MILGINTGFLCYGCRSNKVTLEGDKCPSCSVIDANRERTQASVHLSWAFVLAVGFGLMWAANFVRRNLGE